MSEDSIDVSMVVGEPAEEFSAWHKNQDFDYHRTESAVIDYINEYIDYEKLDTVVEESTDLTVTGFENVFDEFGIPVDSNESKAVRQHIKLYVEKE